MIRKPIGTIEESDLANLLSQAVPEGRDLEFKRDIVGGSDADIKEFLGDVTSLANAQGGDLIFGIEEAGGVASALPGIVAADPDKEILRLENFMRDGIEPRIAARVQWVPISSGAGAIVIRMPASLAAPHRVKFKNSGRFYTRNSRGKYEMDTHELRHAFTAAEEMPARIRALHDDAVAGAYGSNMPFRVEPDPMAVVSVIPLGFFRELRDLDVTRDNALVPVCTSGSLNWMHTLEGILFHTPLNENPNPSGGMDLVRSYARTHRRGRVDAAWTIGGKRDLGQGPTRLVWPHYFEAGVMDVTRSTSAKFGVLGVDGPWAVFVNVAGIKDFELALGNHDVSRPAWRDSAALPEIIVDQISAESLMPIFKAFWLLFGVQRPSDRKVET